MSNPCCIFLQIDIGFDDFGGDVFVHLRFVVNRRDDNAEGDLRIFRRIIAGKSDIISLFPHQFRFVP